MSDLAGRRGRPERAPDLTSGPAGEFARQLRLLKEEAERREGRPLDYRTLARRAAAAGHPRSHSVLADATKGLKLPSWETAEAFVAACGGDVEVWKQRHLEAVGGSAEPAGPTGADAAAVPPRARRRGRWVLALTGAVVGVAALVALAVVVLWPTAASGNGATITVQNMVAIGPQSLTEDVTPSYLSTRPVARCGSLGCKVEGTDMATGIVLAAVCQVTGQAMTNADESSPGIEQNPGTARSARWYGVQRPDGSIAYLSEVYVRAADRGGLDLPKCRAS